TPQEQVDYTRIENYVPSEETVSLEAGQYYFEIVKTNQTCIGQVDNEETAIFGSRTGVRGTRPIGGDAGGPGVAACISIPGGEITLHVTAGDSTRDLQNSILSTFKFTE